MLVTKTIALFVFICLSSSVAEVKNTFNKHGSTENVLDVHLSNNLFSYIKCENTTKSTKCQVFQEPLDGTYEEVTCEIVLDDHVDRERVLLYNFGKDKVVVSWWSENDNVDDHQFIRYSIVHFPECEIAEANIDQQDRDFSALSWSNLRGAFVDHGDDTFDVFYYNETFDKISQVTFDEQGEIVAGPVDSFNVTEDFQHLFVFPTSTEYLHIAILAYSDRTYEFSVFSDDNIWEVFKASGEHYKDFSLSGDQDTIRMCFLKEHSSSIVCKVFNLEEESTSTRRFNAVGIDNFGIQNLANNEFLLLTINRKISYITKYGATGKKQGKIELPKLKYKDDPEDKVILYTKGDEQCVAGFDVNGKEYDVINYCFSSEDFE